jgi:hypothetical protein
VQVNFQDDGALMGTKQTANIYWEPLDGDDKPDWSVWPQKITAKVNADYTIPANGVISTLAKNFKTDFEIETRELNPTKTVAEQKPGADIEMLEAMLWQFGISPQYGYIGEKGTRLGEKSKALNGGFVGGAEGKAARDIFTAGQTGTAGAGSLEKMVRRFQGRSFSTSSTTTTHAGSDDAYGAGVVNNRTLTQLGKVWKAYYDAVDALDNVENASTPFSADNALIDWNTVVAGFETGVLPFSSGAKSVAGTYNRDTHHQNMIAASGAASTITQADIIKAWAKQELDNLPHWGDKKSKYRITEGSADEVGSVGFSQIWFGFLFGETPACDTVANVNMYNPVNNLLGFAAWSSKDCHGNFDKAFNTDDYRISGARGNRGATLQGYQCSTGVCLYTGDSYERLLKGLTGYNTGGKMKKKMTVCSAAEMIVGGVQYDDVDGDGRPIRANCLAHRPVLDNGDVAGTGFNYGLSILHKKLNIPYRKFVWKVIATENNPATPENEEQAYCFAYGEQEWVSGKISWSRTKTAAALYQAEHPDRNKYSDPRVLCN